MKRKGTKNRESVEEGGTEEIYVANLQYQAPDLWSSNSKIEAK
jgi:hypothetical protein